MPQEIKTIEDLEKKIGKVFLIADKGIIKVVCATIISHKMDLDPVWLLLVAPSSGMKSEMINAVDGLDFVHPISDITSNSFISGMKKRGKETSLLFKIGNGVLAFKDFTTILSKYKETRMEIMAQLREIYDGSFTKITGMDEPVTWNGRMGVIAGVTEIIYMHLNDLSAMGNRFVMYTIDQPNRIDVLKRTIQNAPKIIEMRKYVRECFESYINFIIGNNKKIEIKETMKDELMEEFFEIANFVAIMRSAVLTDFKTGEVDFVPSKEMPPRIVSQLYTLACVFITMNQGGILSKEDKKILFKIAFDSIPKMRRRIIYILAKYKKGVSTSVIAVKIDLPTTTARRYLTQINALGICDRLKLSNRDSWKLKEEYRKLIVNYKDIEVVDEYNIGEEEDENEGWDAYDENKEEVNTLFKNDETL